MRYSACSCDQQVMTSETALDVLSHAASLINNEVVCNSRSGSALHLDEKNQTQSPSEKHNRLRDYRIRTLKQRRKKRRDQDQATTKLKARRTTSTQTSVTLMTEASPGDDEADNNPASCSSVYEYEDSCDEQDSDTPLDMTTTTRSILDAKCKENCSPDSTTLRKCLLTPSRSSSHPQQRPSVITRTSSFQSSDDKIQASGPTAKGKGSAVETRHGHRWEILSGMCDPVIDEHFRRSLGKDYPDFLSNSPVPSTVSMCGLSVDDHFAKALGDIWLQLQKKAHPSSTSTPPSLTSELPQPTSPLVQQC